AGIVVFLIGFVGFAVSLFVAIAIPYVSIFAKSFFGKIGRVQAISGATHCALFAFLTAPILFFSTPPNDISKIDE
ncbi:hypothetical protein PMAYCL1PPCAC_22838, partial [Pristionchus mayeri]